MQYILMLARGYEFVKGLTPSLTINYFKIIAKIILK